MIFYEQVERTLEIENAADDEKKKTETEKESPKYFDGIESSLTPWLENKSYTQSGFTIQDMAKTLGTNRTYLNAYIKRMDNRPSVGIREDHAEGASGNEHTKNRGVVRLFVPQLFYQVVH